MKKKIFNLIYNSIFLISLLCLAIIMNICSKKSYLVFDNYLTVSLIITILFGFYLIKKNFGGKIFKEKNKLIILSGLYFTLCTSMIFYEKLMNNMIELNLKFDLINNNIVIAILVLLSCLVLYCSYVYIISICFNIFKKIIKDISLKEKKFIIITWLIFLIVNIIWYTFLNNDFIKDDIIYSIDSYYVLNKMFPNLTWALDIRHVLFSIFTFPFYCVFSTLRKILPFSFQMYPIFVASLNSFFIIITSLLLKKITNNNMFMYLYIASFPAMLYSIIIEKFALCVFFLVLFIYLTLDNEKEKDSELEDFALIGTVGTISTSAFLGLWSHNDEGVKRIFSWLKIGLIFLCISIVLGKLGVLLSINNYLKLYNSLPIVNRIYGLTEMISSCFFAPYYIISNGKFIWQNEAFYLNILGLIIFIICIISFVMNRKNKFAQISFYWLNFSFFLFVIMDWFSFEAPLFNQYFSWAIIGLVCLFIEKIIKDSKVKNIIYVSLILLMLIINVVHLINIFNYFNLYF